MNKKKLSKESKRTKLLVEKISTERAKEEYLQMGSEFAFVCFIYEMNSRSSKSTRASTTRFLDSERLR